MSNRHLRICIATLLIAPSLPVAANQAPHVMLDEIVVTTTRTPTKTSNTVAQTTVITAEQLAHYQGQSAFDVIKSQAGISSYNSGGSDKVSGIYLRGYDNKSILVLIDGIRYSSVSTGTAALGLLPASQIERIEILHGATGSSLYGADAVGGVIQIFTKKHNLDGNRLYATIGAGSHKQLTYGVGANFGNDTTNISLNANHYETDGINAIETPFAASQRDKDGYDSDSGSFAISHKFGDALTLGANALYNKSETEYDNVWSNAQDVQVKQKTGAANVFGDWRHQHGLVSIKYGQSIDKSSNFENTTKTSTFDTKQDIASITAHHNLGMGKAIFGVEHLKQKLTSSTTYTKNSRDVTSGFAGYQFHHDRFDAQAHVRYDDNSQFGGRTTYNVGGAFHISPSMRVGASHATGYRAPTFNELYYPIQWGAGGNPNLKPETSKNHEVFAEYIGNHHRTRLTGYHNDVKNLIVGWTPHNLDKAQTKGVALTSDWQLGKYVFGLNYDYQQAKDKSHGTNNGKLLALRPEHKGLVYAGYHHHGVDLRAEYQYVGKTYRTAGETNPLDSYGLVNLSGTYRLSPNIRVTHRINNLFGEKYHTNKSTSYGTTTTYNEYGTNFLTAITLSY